MQELIKQRITEHIAVVKKTQELLTVHLEQAISVCRTALRTGNKLLFCGNGGSAADAQHLAAEFVGRYIKERGGLPAIALTTDTSILTAVGNDYGFEKIFSRQVQALGQAGDVLIAFSTSGNSANILTAIEEAQRKKLKVIGFTGSGGGKMANVCDVCLCVPETVTGRIQECHILLGHIFCEMLDGVTDEAS